MLWFWIGFLCGAVFCWVMVFKYHVRFWSTRAITYVRDSLTYELKRREKERPKDK